MASSSGEYKHFLDLERITVRLKGREIDYPVEEVKSFNREILMKLKGIDSPEAARTLATGEILVPPEMAAPLRKGEFYQSDLIGCHLFHDDMELGEVLSLFNGAQSDLMEVRRGDNIFFVPFMKNFIGDVDIEAGRIELLAPWLVE